MSYYVCVEVDVDGVCQQWQPQKDFLSLTAGEGAEIGMAILGVMALAWGFRHLMGFIGLFTKKL